MRWEMNEFELKYDDFIMVWFCVLITKITQKEIPRLWDSILFIWCPISKNPPTTYSINTPRHEWLKRQLPFSSEFACSYHRNRTYSRKWRCENVWSGSEMHLQKTKIIVQTAFGKSCSSKRNNFNNV